MPTPILSPDWTLSCQGVTTSAAAAGITAMIRHRASQATDTCTLRFDGRAFDAAPPFPFGATVVITRRGTTWFVGRVTSVPSSGDGRSETQTCELSGPWWYLANLVCQQLWTLRGGEATTALGRLVLGQADDGATLTTGQIITAALQYCIDAGAPLAVGTIEPAVTAPWQEAKDVTCAEVIRRALLWTPDCLAWFDYTTAPVPTFHCRARANLPAATLRVGTPPLAAVRGLTARYDLLVPAVVLRYETSGQSDGQAQTDVTTDAAPPGATGREFGAVVGTIPLRGAVGIVRTQRLVTQPVVTDADAPDLVAQLVSRDAVLAAYAADPAITAAGVQITAVALGAAGSSGDSRAIQTLGNALVEGEITDWMIANCGVQTQAQRLTFSYTLDRGTDAAPDVSAAQEGSVEFTATNAASGVYTTLSSYQPGDETAAPMGLAAAYHAAVSALQYSGRVVLIAPEVGASEGAPAGLGGVVNIAGGAVADWATMRAAVVAEDVDVVGGMTTLTLGPLEADTADGGGLAALLQTMGSGAQGGPAALGTASSASRTTGRPG